MSKPIAVRATIEREVLHARSESFCLPVWKVLSGFLILIREVLVLYSSKTWALHGESEKYPVKGIEIKFSIY